MLLRNLLLAGIGAAALAAVSVPAHAAGQQVDRALVQKADWHGGHGGWHGGGWHGGGWHGGYWHRGYWRGGYWGGVYGPYAYAVPPPAYYAPPYYGYPYGYAVP